MTVADGGVDLGEASPTDRVCSREGCGQPVPPTHHLRTLCDDHYEQSHKKRGPAAKKKGPKADAPPVNLNVNLGGSPGKGKADQTAKKVAAGATQMAQMIAALIIMGGDATCGGAINDGAKAWGDAMGELSRYQPGLAKIFAPTGEATGQAFAWVGVFAATFGMMVPVLVHHGAIRPELALKITGGVGAAAGVAQAVTDDTVPDAA